MDADALARDFDERAGLELDLRDVDLQPVLRLDGQLDLSTAPSLDSQISRLGEVLSRSVVLDLRGLEFVDCAGARPLVRLSNELAANGGQLIVSGATGLVGYVLKEAGLNGSIPQ